MDLTAAVKMGLWCLDDRKDKKKKDQQKPLDHIVNYYMKSLCFVAALLSGFFFLVPCLLFPSCKKRKERQRERGDTAGTKVPKFLSFLPAVCLPFSPSPSPRARKGEGERGGKDRGKDKRKVETQRLRELY